uniref:DoxX family protein n=1 Tax=Rhodosorus marinus TaxID=101924 RepID=A0A7S0BTP8_9RHOD|mmetsp:Transcript_9042/g.13198  ORF Transcript_9042/g.13198 Transcript_9042/m.13198 type:complete len:169 (+) Transcript_9042:222-728(+)
MDFQGGRESDDRAADFVKSATVRLTKIKKVVSPYFPIMARFLLVLTFFEDGMRVLLEFASQVYFLNSHYGMPNWLAGFILIVTVLLSLIGAGLVMTKKYEVYGSYVLLGFLLYQQIMYGHISPVNSGGVGFLFRNLSLAGAFFLLIALKRLGEGKPSTCKNVGLLRHE